VACPDDQELLAMLERSMNPTKFGELEVHIDSCESCRKAVAALAQGSRPHTPPFSELDHQLAPGATIDGRYEVRTELGRGGMGTVYLAHDRTLGRDVALKLHRASSSAERLQREAVAMAKLAHPNVVNVFEVNTVDDRVYVAMEYVRGTTLRGWLGKSTRNWREIVAMLAATGRGLAAAHAAGLVHRDFKPENVLVGDDGRPRVGDFGLARADHAAIVADPESLNTAETMTAGVAGTPAYMAPEQMMGDPVDARCDQFAFCVVAWECLYGKRPFTGLTLAALQLAIEKHELEPGDTTVPERVRAVIERGLAYEPSERFTDMPALLAALERVAAPRTTRNVGRAARARRRDRTRFASGLGSTASRRVRCRRRRDPLAVRDRRSRAARERDARYWRAVRAELARPHDQRARSLHRVSRRRGQQRVPRHHDVDARGGGANRVSRVAQRRARFGRRPARARECGARARRS
jgi:predicted Ser/Thr protein kinase